MLYEIEDILKSLGVVKSSLRPTKKDPWGYNSIELHLNQRVDMTSDTGMLLLTFRIKGINLNSSWNADELHKLYKNKGLPYVCRLYCASTAATRNEGRHSWRRCWRSIIIDQSTLTSMTGIFQWLTLANTSL